MSEQDTPRQRRDWRASLFAAFATRLRGSFSSEIERMSQASPWWDPHSFEDRRPFLDQRGRLVGAMRRFFEARGFTEVDTAMLQVSPGNETHIGAFETTLVSPDGAKSRLYLHTSPEFAAKKLLAAGLPRLFTLAHVFRNGERSALHHPEFTMLEWYRAEATYEKLFDDCADLLAAAGKGRRNQFLRVPRQYRRYHEKARNLDSLRRFRALCRRRSHRHARERGGRPCSARDSRRPAWPTRRRG